MPVFKLDPWIIVIIDILYWPIVQLSISYVSNKIPLKHFNAYRFPFYLKLENKKCYEKFFFIKAWKGLIPDGGAYFKNGFAKKKLKSHDVHYLMDFLKETCRAEVAHFIMFWSFLILPLFNPLWAFLVMFLYAFFGNIPCIIIQRYNRLRLFNLFKIKNIPY